VAERRAEEALDGPAAIPPVLALVVGVPDEAAEEYPVEGELEVMFRVGLEEDPPLNCWPRPLRLPRIWGAIRLTYFSAPVTPLSRRVRLTRPPAMVATRVPIEP
jgi:hypothetical protein